MSDFKKIETDAIERCKEILDSLDLNSAGNLSMNLLDDKEALDDFIKTLFAFGFMARQQNRPDEAIKLSHVASYLSIQGFLFEEFKKFEAAEDN
jgi:hypothetical protein